MRTCRAIVCGVLAWAGLAASAAAADWVRSARGGARSDPATREGGADRPRAAVRGPHPTALRRRRGRQPGPRHQPADDSAARPHRPCPQSDSFET